MSQERSTVEVLKAAKERISDPERWTQRRLSDTLPFRRALDFLHERRTCAEGSCWCMLGAALCESPTEEAYRDAMRALEAAGEGAEKLADFNDGVSHDRVIAAFDRAVELAEATK